MNLGFEMGLSLGVNKPDPLQSTPTAVRTGHGLRRLSLRQWRGTALALALQQSSGTWNVALPTVVTQDAVMPDADQPGGQNVMSETPQELLGAQGEGFDLATSTIIAPSKSDGLSLLVRGRGQPLN